MQTFLLDHGEEFTGSLDVVQGVCGAVTFMYKFLNKSQALRTGDSGFGEQTIANAECIIPGTFAFKTLGVSWIDTYLFLTTIWQSKSRTAWSLLIGGGI